MHRARVASRRLREAIPVLAVDAAGPGARKARRQLRRLTRALGAVRELDVTVALIDELGRQNELPRLALEQVRAQVIGHREAQQAALAKRLDRAKLAKLERRIEAVHDALRERDSDHWRAALAKRLVKRSKRLRTALRDAGTIYEVERLHRVRLAVKKLRYAMELAADAGLRTAARPVRSLERAQDTLGRLHDFQILQVHVAALQARPPSAATSNASFEAIARSVEEECRHLHARYVGSIPDLLSALDSSRTAVIPELLQGTVRRTQPIKMELARRPVARRTAARAGERS